MRKLLALLMFLVLAVGSASASGEPPKASGQIGPKAQPPTANAQTSRDDRRGTDEIPLVIRNYPQTTARDAAEAEDDRVEKSNTDWWVVVIGKASIGIGVLTFVILIVQAVVFWRTRRDTQKQARAHVYISGPPQTSLLLQNSSIVEYRFWFKWKNSGLTPAMECAMWTAIQQIPSSQQMPTLFTKAGKPGIKVPLGPKQSIDSTSMNISVLNLTNIFDKETRCFVWGLAEYRDVFSKTKDPIRHTEICLEIMVDNDPRLSVNPAHPPHIRFQGIEQQNSSS